MPMTEHLSDKNLVDLAKQNFENRQKNTIPSIIVPLPSNGLVYPKSSPLHSGQVEMRYMTAYDEDILTNATYIKQGVVLDKLIKSLILNDVNLDEMIVADRDVLIIAARIHGYGNEYTVTVTDPETKSTLNRVLDLSKLEMNPFLLQADENGEFEYRINSETVVKFKFLNKTESNSISSEHALSDFLKKSIKQVNETRDAFKIEQYIRYQMKPIESKQLRTYISDNMPGIKLEAEFEGENGGTFTARFQIGSDLFWV